MRSIYRTGCQWRSLPACFPAWTAVYYYFRCWQHNYLWVRLNEAVNRADRRATRAAAFARYLRACGWTHQRGSRQPSARGLVPVAKRWVVERTFAWLNYFRRRAIDYEFTPARHETWLLIAHATRCLHRLHPT